MEAMQEASLDQMLITIPPQGQEKLDQKISDVHLAEIARALTNWESVCSNLGISEPEEEVIKEENRRADAQRYVILFSFPCVCLYCNLSLFVRATGHGRRFIASYI